MKILSFGEVLWDVFFDGEFIGGAPLNFAAHLAKMGEDTYILTSVGNDDLGDRTTKKIEDFGVKTNFITVSKTLETGKCLVTLDSNKIPKYNLLNNVAYDQIKTENIPNDFDYLYFGTLALRSGFNRDSLKEFLLWHNFKDVFVDVNIRPPFYSDESVEFAVKNATILKVSDEELPVISNVLGIDNSNEFAKKLCEKYCNLKLVIITRGGSGSYCFDVKNNREHTAECVKVKVASTVGAGDSFSAAFLHKYLSGCDTQNCLDFASKISAFVVSKTEAIPEYKIEDFE